MNHPQKTLGVVLVLIALLLLACQAQGEAASVTPQTTASSKLPAQFATATATLTATPQAGEVTIPNSTTLTSFTATPSPTGCVPNSQYLADVTIPDRTVVQPGLAFTKTWRVRNTGNCAWATGDVLMFLSGTQMAATSQVALPIIAPGATVDISIPMQAPTQPGQYSATWRGRTSSGQFFGTNLTVVIIVPGTPTTTPTRTLTPAQPSPTAPLVDLPPFDGGMNVDQTTTNNLTSFVVDELVFEIDAHDSTLSGGQENGDGIKRVDMSINDPNNNIVYGKTENNARYCLFGGGDNGSQCTIWNFLEHNNQWPNGKPIQKGLYFLRAVAYGESGRTRSVEFPIYIDQSGAGTDVNTFVVETGPNNNSDLIEGSLAFQAEASDQGVGNNNGDGLARVIMQILNTQGQIVYQRTEQNVKYCAFSGGDGGNPCEVWVFAQHDNKWPSGIPIYKTEYTLRSIAIANDGGMFGSSSIVQVISFE